MAAFLFLIQFQPIFWLILSKVILADGYNLLHNTLTNILCCVNCFPGFLPEICIGLNWLSIAPFQHYTDPELLFLCKQGNRQAFEAIYYRYWSPLYAYAYNRLRARLVCEEIIQEVFLTLWVKRETSEKIVSLSAYLFTGVKYRMLNEIKAGQVRKNFATSFTAFQAANHSHNTEETMAETDLYTALQANVDRLPPKCRQIFQLSRNQH